MTIHLLPTFKKRAKMEAGVRVIVKKKGTGTLRWAGEADLRDKGPELFFGVEMDDHLG